MHGRYAVNRGLPEWQRFAPIQLVDRAYTLGSQPSGHAGRNDELRLATIRQPAQSGQIQVIVVIVAEEYGIDAEKILPPHARLPVAARTDGGERTGPLGPDGIGQNVEVVLLEQHGGMVDQRNPQMSAFHARRRLGWLHVGNETGAWFRPAGELPSQNIEKAARRGGVGIEEALPVKVPRKWQCAGVMLHRFLFTHSFRAGQTLAQGSTLIREPVASDVG